MKRLATIGVVLVALIAVGAGGFAFAATGDSGTPISACVKNSNGAVRLVATGTACKSTEHAVSWNNTGPTGLTGAAGATGPAGPASSPCVAATPGTGSTAVNLKVDGILGDGTDSAHAKEITPLTYAFGAGASATSCPGNAAASFGDLTITKAVDRSSAALFAAAMPRTTIPTVTLSLRKPGAGNTDYQTLVFSNVKVSGIRPVGSPTGIPAESVSFSYTKLSWTYRPQKSDGTFDTPVVGCYDLAAGATC